jgi:hypothetical protein
MLRNFQIDLFFGSKINMKSAYLPSILLTPPEIERHKQQRRRAGAVFHRFISASTAREPSRDASTCWRPDIQWVGKWNEEKSATSLGASAIPPPRGCKRASVKRSLRVEESIRCSPSPSLRQSARSTGWRPIGPMSATTCA